MRVLKEGGDTSLLFSRDSLAVMIHLLTYLNRNHFLSSLFMPCRGSVRYISRRLKYCYLETRCRATALSLFDILNFMSTMAIRSMHHVWFLERGRGCKDMMVLFLKAMAAGLPIVMMYCHRGSLPRDRWAGDQRR